jgi:hypothetical protein
MLNQAIQARVQNLGQLSSLGANAASGVGNAAMQMGGNIAKLYGNIGSAQAGSAVAQGQSQTNLIGQLTGMMGMGGGF